jgi:plasmid maintenance system antidote protein VapI
MSSNAVIKRHVDPDIFKAFIKEHNVSIRQLGSFCQTNEKSIRRMLQDREVTLNIALDLCTYFDCNFNQLFGQDTRPEWKKSMVDILKKVR